MNKNCIKYFAIFIILCLTTCMLTGTARAEEVEEVSHRELAIACAMAWVTPREGKTLSNSWDIGGTGIVNGAINFINGQFNLHNYAGIDELDDWTVSSVYGGLTGGLLGQKGTAGYALQKGNNVMIVFRSTDTEAMADVAYGLKNEHNQEPYAIEYVRQVMEQYSKKEGDFNIYVTGHSLGGYLAQVAGAIVEKDITENPEKYANLELKQIVDFNGIGINNLTYFGEQFDYGKKQETIKILKKLGEEQRLIEYYTYGDLVSALGVHYGEMRLLYPSIDSISYHRENYDFLGTFGSKLLTNLTEKDIINIFKTDISGAQKFYQINNIAAYLNLTHESDTFVIIDLEEAAKTHEPTIEIKESKNLISAHISKGKNTIETDKSITLKALTSYAAVRKYVWYSSDDGEKWTAIKTCDIRNLEGVAPTNTLDINISDIKVGANKYYKVEAFYDDGYVSSKATKDSNGQYVYEGDNKTHINKEGSIIKEIVVKRKDETIVKKVVNTIKNIVSKITNKIKGLFRR